MPFREFHQSEISDPSLYRSMLTQRFMLLETGRPIYCTAVNPDKKKRQEHNPHDDRAGTVHIAAVDSQSGDIACILSLAVDTGERERGDIVGLPLENRWRQNGYPEGSSLDRFREIYLALNYQSKMAMAPWQMVELYRHFKTAGGSDIADRNLHRSLPPPRKRSQRAQQTANTHMGF